MDEDTITFLRALCAKAKEVAVLCDAYLEQESRKSKKAPAIHVDEPKPAGNRLIRLTKWNEYHSWQTTAGLRSLIFNDNLTGSDYFIRRAGRRVLICEKSFFEWTNMTQEQRIKASPAAMSWKEKYRRR